MMKIGSNEHLRLFCRSFIDSHPQSDANPSPWPTLDPLLLQRIRHTPFWSHSLRAKSDASQRVNALAQMIKDPLLREAIALQGVELQHQVAALRSFMTHYDMELPPLSADPRTPTAAIENACIDIGYRECLDAFLACGLFQLVQQTDWIFPDLLSVFDLFLAEQTRHIIFFVNLLAYRNEKLGRRWSGLRSIRAIWQDRHGILTLMNVFGPKEDSDAPPAITWLEAFTLDQFLEACQQEHTRRLEGFDPNLVRPQLSSTLAKGIQESLRLWPQRQSQFTA